MDIKSVLGNVDADGIIVAKGLRGEYLDNKLKELLK